MLLLTINYPQTLFAKQMNIRTGILHNRKARRLQYIRVHVDQC